jgi:hypothetical protein
MEPGLAGHAGGRFATPGSREGTIGMGYIVAKFGGSSLCDAGQFRKVKDILRMDPRRVYVVPSAPGKRCPGDDKVTDLLYKTCRLRAAGEDWRTVFGQVEDRYRAIAGELSLPLDLEGALLSIRRRIEDGAGEDYCASRGEYLNGLLLSDYLGFAFVDPKDCIFFTENGTFDSERTNEALGARLSGLANAVVPGFYGSLPDGSIHTFSRGGSDITGAIVARAAGADLYENWTDVSGFLMADPRIVEGAQSIRSITYRELHGRDRAARGQRFSRAPRGHPHQHPQHQLPRPLRHHHHPPVRGREEPLPHHGHRGPHGLFGHIGGKGHDELRKGLRPPRAAGGGGSGAFL